MVPMNNVDRPHVVDCGSLIAFIVMVLMILTEILLIITFINILGEYSMVSDNEKQSILLNLPVASNGIMDISKLSARESDLRDALHYRKYKDQFVSHSPTMKSQKSFLSISSNSSDEGNYSIIMIIIVIIIIIFY